MKNKIYKMIFLPALCLIMFLPAGCELEYVDTGKIEASSFPKTEEEAKTLLNYMYHYFSRNWDGIFTANLMCDAVTDQFECSWGWAGYLYNYYEAGEDLYHSGPTRQYPFKSLYEYVSLLSTLILDVDRMNTAEFDETRKARYIAELKCGMGWLAFMLYDNYGPVPLPTLDILKNPLRGGGIMLERASEEEMQAFIETNLKEAAEELPYSNYSTHENRYSAEDYGRFTKGLAKFVLMKYYMLMARWNDAEAIGRELAGSDITSVYPANSPSDYGYKLMDNYNDLYTLANEKNAESIYSAWASPDSYHEWLACSMPGDFNAGGLNLQRWGGYKAPWPFYETYEAGDKRLERIIGEYIDVNGTLHNKATDRDGGQQGMLYKGAAPLKYDWTSGVAGSACAIDFVVYRYADALTLLSEAIVRKGGAVTQEAVTLLNRVRQRAGLKAYTLAELSNVDVFMEKMLLERGHEFLMEGVRRQDLIRHGKFIEFAIEKNQYAGQPTRQLETPEGALKYQRFAIPMYHITNSKGYIQQNPGF
jgi:hypothetical protein